MHLVLRSSLPLRRHVAAATAGIDLDIFGFGTGDEFRFVRLRDDPNEGLNTGLTIGADIDAVGAISSRRVNTVPEPQTAWLLTFGLGLACAFGRRSWNRQPIPPFPQ